MRFYKPQKGASLPSLSNPATRDNIQAGFEAIDGTGKKVAGQLFIDKFYTKKNVAIPLETQHHAGVPYADTMLHLTESAGNATAADIAKGKTALTDDGKITGTLEVTGGEPSYTLQIMTENPEADIDIIIYYAPGSSKKTNLSLTNALQTITCGDFICLNRGESGNSTTGIQFLGSNGATLMNASVGVNNQYLINAVAIGCTTINIGAVKRDYPNVAQILVKYVQY